MSPAPTFTPAPVRHAEIVAATRIWLERAVIGLYLCPVAKAVRVKKQGRPAVGAAMTKPRDADPT